MGIFGNHKFVAGMLVQESQQIFQMQLLSLVTMPTVSL
jgi:hypothetical protein